MFPEATLLLLSLVKYVVALIPVEKHEDRDKPCRKCRFLGYRGYHGFFSRTFRNPCFQYSPIVNIENLDLKKSEIYKHPCFQYSL